MHYAATIIVFFIGNKNLSGSRIKRKSKIYRKYRTKFKKFKLIFKKFVEFDLELFINYQTSLVHK
jgi:hypothetical protein